MSYKLTTETEMGGVDIVSYTTYEAAASAMIEFLVEDRDGDTVIHAEIVKEG